MRYMLRARDRLLYDNVVTSIVRAFLHLLGRSFCLSCFPFLWQKASSFDVLFLFYDIRYSLADDLIAQQLSTDCILRKHL